MRFSNPFAEATSNLNKKTIIHLTIIRALNIVFPLAIYKFSLHRLGSEEFGKFLAAQALVIFAAIFTNAGLDLSGPILVGRAEKTENTDAVNAIVLMTIVLRLCSTIISAPMLLMIGSKIGVDTGILIIALHQIFFESLHLGFYYQGIQQVSYLSAATLLSRVITMMVCIIMIRDPSDVKTYIVAHGLGNLACLVHLYISARNKFGLRISKLNLEKFKTFSRETYALFTGNFLGKIYQNSTRLAFSTFLPANQLTSFDVADKITNIVAIPVNVVIESQLHKAGAGKISSRSNMAQLSMIAIALLSISATAILFSRLLVTALYSHDVNNTANILKILILATSVGIVNSYIRTFVYLNNNETSKSNSLLAVASSTNIAAILLAGQLNLYTSITGPLIFFGTEILVLGLLVRNSNYSTKKREKNDNT